MPVIDDPFGFVLDRDFVANFIKKQPKWGPIGYVTYKRTYARPIESIPPALQVLANENGLRRTEEFWLTLTRVVEGVYSVQRWHCLKLGLPWSDVKAQESAQEMFRLMWDFRFLPPGRGLWMMGTEYIANVGGAALNNCGFVSTRDINHDFADPFCFLMDMSMLGVGVGGDTRGIGKVTIQNPALDYLPHVVPDSREGWVELVRRILNAFVGVGKLPLVVDYSQIRPEGSPIRGFGGVASGPAPLKKLAVQLCYTLNSIRDQRIDAKTIVDLFNHIGVCVVSGNVRRSAEIMFGFPEDSQFLTLKDPKTAGEELLSHRWASNNSIFATVGMDYSQVAGITAANGEPGYQWLDNARFHGRFMDPADDSDSAVQGANPCGEMPLEHKELCNLVETFPSLHQHYTEFERTLKFAYLYAKTVALIPTHNSATNAVMMRNRRIGCSQSGIVQSFQRHGRRIHFTWCNFGYEYLNHLDRIYSDWLCIPRSKRKTSVKPSGTVSLLPGVTPGVHYEEAEFYFRTVRFARNSSLVQPLRDAGYRIEDDVADSSSVVTYFPVQAKFFERCQNQVSMWEQLETAAQMQHYWADNQVSCTVKFRPEEAKDIEAALELYETRLKGISFLPYVAHGYAQAPYQPITEEQYVEAIANLRPLVLDWTTNEVIERFCDGDKCSTEPLR